MFGKKKAEKEEWDGSGSGTWANIKRWWYTRVRGYVVLREFYTYWDAVTEKDDKNPFDCKLTHKLIKRKDVPPEAVHCTGEPYVWSVDHSKIRYDLHDEGFRATDAWLYMEFGGFDDCLTKRWTELDHVDMKKVLIIGGIVILACIGFMIMRAG